MKLKTIATFGLGDKAEKSFVSVNIVKGSVVDFYVSSDKKTKISSSPSQGSPLRVGAIINAANQRCIGGGGVDGAINTAGGPNLWKDREALPLLSKEGKRCNTGGAVVTGPGRYGNLRVNYVVHAVGPVYSCFSEAEDEKTHDRNDALLRSAYQESLQRCREKGITDVGFSLLSAGVFRGERSLSDVLTIGVVAICDWVIEQGKTDADPASDNDRDGKTSSSPHRLQSVTLCGYTNKEVNTLIEACLLVVENKDCEQTDRRVNSQFR